MDVFEQMRHDLEKQLERVYIENEKLRALVSQACETLEEYDLTGHAAIYRNTLAEIN